MIKFKLRPGVNGNVTVEILGKVPPAGMRVDRNGHVWGWTYTNGNKAYTTAAKAKRAADAIDRASDKS